MTIELTPLPFDEAIEAFTGLVPMRAEEFYALAEEARASAFTVAHVTKMDVLVDMHKAVEKAMRDGETLADFRDRTDDIFQARGWATPPEFTPWRMETIFRNNVQTAYNAGRYKQMVDQKERFPYWEYDAVGDSDTTDLCKDLDGRIYPADDPFWDTYYPQNHHKCRSSVNAVHKHIMEEEGLTVETEMPGELPAEGWKHNSAKERWQPDLNKYPDELREQYEAERRNT